jgi:hypothetical protein
MKSLQNQIVYKRNKELKDELFAALCFGAYVGILICSLIIYYG